MCHDLLRVLVAPLVSFIGLAAAPAALRAQPPGVWENAPPLQLARQEVGAALLNGQLYVAGGLDANRAAVASVERYDPTSRSWSFVKAMPTTLHHFGMDTAGGRLFVMGGYVTTFTGTDAVWAYDPGTDQWTPRTKMPAARGAFVAVTINGLIYAVGGVHPTRGVVGDLTVYDPATDQWRTLAPMPTPREHLAAATIGGKLYVAGGRTGALFATLEIYDPATAQWTAGRSMPTARGGNGAAVLDGKLIVCGGEGGPRGNFPETEEYDPATDAWRTLTPMSTPLHGIYPVTVGDAIVVAGGGTSPGYAATNVVLTFRRQPTGVVSYGASSKACAGAIQAWATAKPVPSDPLFALRGSPNAPPNTTGVLLLGRTPELAGVRLLGIAVHVGVAPPVLLLPVASDAQGGAVQTLPIPAGTAGGGFFAQFVWLNTVSCTNGSPLSASDALGVVVQ